VIAACGQRAKSVSPRFGRFPIGKVADDAGMRLIRESITTKELRTIEGRIRAGFYNVKGEKERVFDAANKH
jgi:hypothetical protein